MASVREASINGNYKSEHRYNLVCWEDCGLYGICGSSRPCTECSLDAQSCSHLSHRSVPCVSLVWPILNVGRKIRNYGSLQTKHRLKDGWYRGAGR